MERKGKRKYKRGLNVATEQEYYAAWSNNDNYYNDVWNGSGAQEEYNYSMTQDHGWQTPQKHFSMVLTQAKPSVTIGPKYFPAEMYNDDDDEEEEIFDEDGTKAGALQNSTCKCTGVHKGVAKIKQIKKVKGERYNNIKNKATSAVDSFSAVSHESTTQALHNSTHAL